MSKRTARQLDLKIKNLPTSPGVYLFKNSAGKILYIGKAKNLRNRVRTYFQSSRSLDALKQRLVAQIVDLELLVTDSEVEALILEANLVHEHKPRYNVALKDDKHYPYIKVTTDEPFPRILIVRRLDGDGATYFGPFTSSRSMRRTVAFLTRLFRIRTCTLTIPHPKGKKQKICLDYHIGRCGGPCEDLQSQEDYAAAIDATLMVLSGKSKALICRLQEKMDEASANLEFETAAALRDQIEALQSMMIRQKVDVGELVDRDIVSLAREGRDAVAVVMQLREGILIGRQDFQLITPEEDCDEEVLRTFVTQYYNHQPNLPQELHLPLKLKGQRVVIQWLRQMKGRVVKIVTPQIGDKSKLVSLAARNARLLLDEILIQKRSQSERTSKMVTALKDELGLTRSPLNIVCFDISNTGETDAVGSCVYFSNGRPRKKEYRHFRIKTVQGQDDFKMMQEVIGRYFRRIAEEEASPPDLVVVDGGKGQLSAAKSRLQEVGFPDQSVISLAKRLEEVFVPGQKDSIVINRSSPSLMLLKRLRDEAHRFAITYNRKVRSKRTIRSQLDDIPGVGPAKRNLLLKRFGSVARIKKASVGDLVEVKGINEKLAAVIVEALGGG